MINKIVFSLGSIPLALSLLTEGPCQNSTPSAKSPSAKSEVMSPMEKMQMMTPSELPSEQKMVYDRLGPMYQKIYLYAFGNEERHRTVVYIKRGLNPYQAMNTIMRVEERNYNKVNKSTLTPAERAMKNDSNSPDILHNFESLS